MYCFALLAVPLLILLLFLLAVSLRVHLCLCIDGFNAVLQADLNFLYFFSAKNIIVINIIDGNFSVFVLGRRIKPVKKKKPGRKKKGKKTALLKHIRVKSVAIQGAVGAGDDAAATAMLCGIIIAALNGMACAFCPRVRSYIEPLYGQKTFRLKMDGIIGIG